MIQISERIWSWAKKEICSSWNYLSPNQVWRILNNQKIIVFNFQSCGNRFIGKNWIIGKRASTGRPACTAWSGAALNQTCVERSSAVPAFTVPTVRARQGAASLQCHRHPLVRAPTVIIIRSARVSSKPRYFPHFASRRALCTAQCCSFIRRCRQELRRHRVGPHPRATLRWAVDQSVVLFAFPHWAELERAAHLCSLLSVHPVGHCLKHRRPAVLLRLRTAAVWSTSSSLHPLKEAPMPLATSSPSVARCASLWPGFSIHSLTPSLHPWALPDRHGARPPLQAHYRPPNARLTIVSPRSPWVTTGSHLWWALISPLPQKRFPTYPACSSTRSPASLCCRHAGIQPALLPSHAWVCLPYFDGKLPSLARIWAGRKWRERQNSHCHFFQGLNWIKSIV
jgi:hypothetical protein